MTAVFLPSRPSGTVEAPPSKSMAHRALIAAALANEQSVVDHLDMSDDIRATIDCLRALGAEITFSGDSCIVDGHGLFPAKGGAVLPCRESASTLRFLIPLVLTTDKDISFTGSARLFSRPLGIYAEICREQGLLFQLDNNQLKVRGRLKPGKYVVPGNVSSQFISGLCFALPGLDGDSVVEIIPPVESAPYLEMTLQMLARCGTRIRREDNRLLIPGRQRFSPFSYTVEGDWTNAAYLEALGCESGDVRVTGLEHSSVQGDRIYPALFDALCKDAPVIDLANCPDLGPVLFALAAFWHGGVFTGIRRLRMKESDRIAAMAEELTRFGARLKIGTDTVTVLPAPLHAPDGILWGHGDHRVVMALSVPASVLGGTIRGAEAVNKSFPGYFDVLRELGVKCATVDET